MSERLDAYLVSKGLAASRERAKTLIKEGKVTVNGKVASKPSITVTDDDDISAGSDLAYVGRGALKLIKAIETFGIDLKDRVCADIGASTGGFTQVMLEKGARKVYAVDVGHGQLAASLREDPRVINMEGTNVRELTASDFDEPVTFMSVDLSFISLTLVAEKLVSLLAEGGEMAVLIKPQFEAGRKALNGSGIVKDAKEHIRVLTELAECFKSLGAALKGLTYSPVKGGSGNIEYLAHLAKGGESSIFDFKALVNYAFSDLRGK